MDCLIYVLLHILKKGCELRHLEIIIIYDINKRVKLAKGIISIMIVK